MKNKIYKVLLAIIAIIVILFGAYYIKDYLHSDFNNNVNDYNSEVDTDIELTEAIVTKVIDGDTIWVNINGKEEKVRFIGVNSPEYTKKIEKYGKEATEYTTSCLLGKTIYLQKDVSNTDDYDRLLRYVWLEKITTITEENIQNYLFNAKLVAEGLAQSNYYYPDVKYQKYLEDIEKQAKENKRGMWQ